MVDLTSVVGNLQRLGFFDFVLPWLLFFAVILGILLKVGFLGDNKKLLSIVAAVLAFFIVNFTPIGGISAFYSKTFGVSAMILSTLLVFVIFVGALGFKTSGEEKEGGLFEKNKAWAYPIIALILVVFAVAVFAQATGGALLPSIGISGDNLTLILILVFVLLVIGFVMGGGAGADEGKDKKGAPPAGHGPAQ